MKSPFRFLLAGAALLAVAYPMAVLAQGARPGAASTRPAQPAAPSSSTPHKIGLVDVGHIFSNYQKLKDRRDLLQKEIEASDGELKQIQAQIQQITETLKSGTITKGSDKWTEYEQQLTQLNADGQAKMAILRREFARKEVQMYKEIYDEVAYTVAAYANANGRNYTLILRYQREPSETEAAEDPNKVMSRVNQLVVYHQEGDDITDTILNFLNNQYSQQAGRPAAPAGPARN